MRKILILILSAILLNIFTVSANTFSQDTIRSLPEDTVIIDLNFDENLDSLLNLYYVGQSMADNPDFWNNESDSLIPSFSDSVYIHRIKKIPTVVDLTYNSIVRRYIDVYARQKRSSVEVMLGLSQYYFPLFDEVFDYSANYPSGDSYSIIKMFLFDKSGVLIRKRLFSALSADRYGFKIDPINKVLSQQQCYLHIL